MKLTSKLALCAALSTAIGAGFVGCKCGGTDDGGDVVIGAYLSMTGSTAEFGTNTKKGAELAVAEVNRAGGIRGRQLKLVTIDDQGNAAEAGNAVTRLIDVEDAVVLLGEVQSSLSLVGGRIAQRRGVAMVSPSSTNEQVTEIGDHVFRVCFIDPFQGYVMARFARENLHMERVAIFKDVRSDYSIGLAEAFEEHFTRMGGTIVAEESYNAGETEFSAQLTTIKDANPQAIFVPGYYSEVGNIARQARRLGIEVPLLGGDGWDGPLHELAGEAIVGSYWSNHFAPDNQTPRAREFITAYEAAHDGQTPTGLAALGYDAAGFIIDAMRRAPDFQPASIQRALAATETFEGVTGTIRLDARRNPVKPAVVLRVTADGDAFETSIDPPDQD
jgi:branched-chain amino acid transport system substrate-binding protein